ncbi:hypothetical protein YC2023_117474 [Brassica napus]
MGASIFLWIGHISYGYLAWTTTPHTFLRPSICFPTHRSPYSLGNFTGQEPGRYNDGRGQHIADSVFEASMMEDPVMVAAGVSKQRRQRWSSRARGGETECWF